MTPKYGDGSMSGNLVFCTLILSMEGDPALLG